MKNSFIVVTLEQSKILSSGDYVVVLWIGVLFVIIFHLVLFWLLHRSLFRTARVLADPILPIPMPPNPAAYSTVTCPIKF